MAASRTLIRQADALAERLATLYFAASPDRPRQRLLRETYMRSGERLRRRRGESWERFAPSRYWRLRRAAGGRAPARR